MIVRQTGESACIVEVERDISHYRFDQHLRLDFGVLSVYPQLLYLDIRAMLRDFEA